MDYLACVREINEKWAGKNRMVRRGVELHICMYELTTSLPRQSYIFLVVALFLLTYFEGLGAIPPLRFSNQLLVDFLYRLFII